MGGNWDNGSNAGFFNWNANNAPSNANTNIGSRLIFLILDYLFFAGPSSPLGENNGVTDSLRIFGGEAIARKRKK